MNVTRATIRRPISFLDFRVRHANQPDDSSDGCAPGYVTGYVEVDSTQIGR